MEIVSKSYKDFFNQQAAFVNFLTQQKDFFNANITEKYEKKDIQLAIELLYQDFDNKQKYENQTSYLNSVLNGRKGVKKSLITKIQKNVLKSLKNAKKQNQKEQQDIENMKKQQQQFNERIQNEIIQERVNQRDKKEQKEQKKREIKIQEKKQKKQQKNENKQKIKQEQKENIKKQIQKQQEKIKKAKQEFKEKKSKGKGGFKKDQFKKEQQQKKQQLAYGKDVFKTIKLYEVQYSFNRETRLGDFQNKLKEQNYGFKVEHIERKIKKMNDYLQNKQQINPRYQCKLVNQSYLQVGAYIVNDDFQVIDYYEQEAITNQNESLYINFKQEDSKNIYEQILNQTNKRLEKMQKSGFTVVSLIIYLEMIFTVPGYEIGSYIQLQKQIQNKKTCLNVQNKDNYCLIYCFMMQLYLNVNEGKIFKNFERASKNDFEFTVTLQKDGQNKIEIKKIRDLEINLVIEMNIDFPCTIDQILKFCKKMKTNVNIFQQVKNQILIMENYYDEQNLNKMNLLLLEEGNKNDNQDKNEEIIQNKHIVLIKNINTLINNDEKSYSYYCERCLYKFRDQTSVDNHQDKCFKNLEKCSNDIYPTEKNKFIQFKETINSKGQLKQNGKKSIDSPFYFTIDAESILVKEQQINKKTETINNHQNASWGVSFYSEHEDLLESIHQEIFIGKNATIEMLEFIQTIKFKVKVEILIYYFDRFCNRS